LNLTPNAHRLDLNAFSCVTRLYARIVCFLLLITAISLITAPLTQYLWTWDHFLHGGQDFEFGALAVLTTLCLVFLLAQSCKQRVGLLFAAWHLLSFICDDRVLARTARSKTILAFRGERVSSPVLDIYNLPLQI
jgi:hypothetical protein